MRLTSLLRRSVAVTAATALVSGGLASGFLAAPALAAGEPTISSVNPAAAINSAPATLTINGQNFLPAADKVYFEPLLTGDGVTTINATVNAQTSTALALQVTADFTRAAPGSYRVRVDQTTVGTVTATCDSCFAVTSQGPATASGVTTGTANGTKSTYHPTPLTLTGSNIAKGATVSFLKPDGTPDAALAFKPGWTDGTSGYIDFSTLRGSYTYAASGQPPFTPGRHTIRLDNTVQPFATPTLDFFQPFFEGSGVVPDNLGQGATQQVVTVTGKGFRSGSKIEIAGHSPSSSCPSDMTIGQTSFAESGSDTVLTAPVTIANSTSSCSYATGARTVGVRGPDGGYYAVAGAFTVNASPTISSIAPNELGQGGRRSVLVTGTGFSAANPPVFTFSSSKVSAVTTSVTGTTTASVTITAASDAVPEDLGVTVTNPSDHGSKSYAASAELFTINPGPTISALPTPGSTGLGTTSSTITVKGSNFDGDNGMVVALYKGKDADGNPIPSTDTHVIDVVVSPAGLLDPAGTPDTLTFRVQVDAGATPGPRDVYLENNGDKGAYLCVQCFGIDSLALSPNAGSNTGTYTLHVIGQGIKSDGTSSVELIRVNAPAAEPHIVGSWVTSTLTDADASQADATFNLKDVAPGSYNGFVQVDPTTSLFCSRCFTVAGQSITVTGVSPSSAGQGAVGVPITITGTNFSRGQIVSIPDVVVRDVTFVDNGHLSALVDIDANAATGAKTVTVTNADGAKNAQLASGFTVNAGPKPTDAKNGANAATWGQGAGKDGSKQTITVTGPGFITGASGQPSSTLDLGPGITVSNVVVTQSTSPLSSADTLTADIVVAYDAPTGFHNVVVTNPDRGVGTLSGKLEIKPGPKPTSVSPGALRPGQTGQNLVITGSGFSGDAVPTIDGLELTNPSVNADGTQLSVTASVKDGASLGFRSVAVTNTVNKGYGTCNGCFAIANPPSAPQGLSAVSGPQSLTATWFAPVSNGGAPITKYVVSALRSGTSTAVTKESTSTSATLTGLVNGATYAVRVVAVNLAGPGAPAGPVTVVPGKAVTLSNVASSKTVTSGSAMTFRGTLSSAGVALAGRTVTLRFTPKVGSAFTRTVTTSSTGGWSYRYVPTYLFSMAATYAGDATYRPGSSSRLSITVPARVTRTSPSASPSTSSASSVLKVTGKVSPNKRGKYVYLYRYLNGTRYLVARATLSSTSTFVFTGRPGRGTHVYRVYIPATTGNAAGYSAAFTVKRV